MKWTILIATIERRQEKLAGLLGQLLPQVEAAGGEVTVEALWNRGERPIGYVRQDLVRWATADYVNFVDDDDEVPPYYVEKVLPLLDGVDYIGWRMQAYFCGTPYLPTYHSLKYDHWHEDDKGYYRDISHLNPVRRAMLSGVSFCADKNYLQHHEDQNWADQLRGKLQTEHFIEDVMYHYRYDPRDSVQHNDIFRAPRSHRRPVVQSPYFSWHPASSA